MAAFPPISPLSLTIREQVLSGSSPSPGRGAPRPYPYQGTRAELLDIISDTVHQTINNLDYDGLWPYLKIADQLDQGKTFGEIQIDSRNETLASTCVGMGHAILKNIKEAHGIEGMLAVQKKLGDHPFEHGAVIIECTDGFVLLDARSDPNLRIFSIPFNSTEFYSNFSYTASEPGSATPLILHCTPKDQPECTFEFCTDVVNGDDIVMKHYVMESSQHDFVPISLYRPDGSAAKFIGIIPGNVPGSSKIILKDLTTQGPLRTQEVAFAAIRKGELRTKLKAFMESIDGNPPLQFHLSLSTIHEQIERFASTKEPLRQLFKSCRIDERLS